tara:strand:- start:219 stop:395 length:177 start_codon:yes stop_codon:yes gene_type:complete
MHYFFTQKLNTFFKKSIVFYQQPLHTFVAIKICDTGYRAELTGSVAERFSERSAANGG